MAGVKKKANNIISQEKLGNELLSEEVVEEIVDVTSEFISGDSLEEIFASESHKPNDRCEHIFVPDSNVYQDLRSHERNYVAANKKAHEAIVSVCYAKTGKRVTLSVRQAETLIGFSKGDWLDIKYSDATNTVLIGKSEGAYGVSPINNDKKHIIYDTLTVKDFKDTLYLDFDNCSSHSAYSYKMVQVSGRPYIALSHDDFT